MNNPKKLLIGAIIGLLAACLILFIYDYFAEEQVAETPAVVTPIPSVTEEEEPTEEEPVIEVKTIELAMIGDVLLHTELAKYEDFSSSFEPLSDTMRSYDYLIANQESMPVASKFGISGYPQFSSPDYIITDLKEAGVDMLNIGNNHTLDKYEDGLKLAIENIEKEGLPYVGAYKNAADRAVHRIADVDGIQIGVLSYTYGTNGISLKQGSEMVVNYLDIEQMKKDVEQLKPLVDVTVMIIHWGVEYVTKENENQRYIAQMMNQAGVDIIFGGHPHVLQPYDKLVHPNSGQETHVFYSLGNFFARTITSQDTMIGGIGSFRITKEGEIITIDQPKLVASSLLKDNDGVYRVYPLKDVESRSVQNLQWVKAILGEQVIVE